MKYHNNIDALVWLDTSAEQSALYHQAFALARLRIEELLKSGVAPSAICVFSDCDETVLDNSEYNSWLVFTGRNFTTPTWDAYCKAQRSRACSGAIEFAQWLQGKGIPLFYVTSRSDRTRAATYANMSELGFPLTPADNTANPVTTRLFMADMKNPDGSDAPWTKYLQYAWIQANRGVIGQLWLGDNLGDFAEFYKKQRWDLRLKQADDVAGDRDNWGKKYIVMPNPVYGNWLFSYRSKTDGPTYLDDEAAAYTKMPAVVRSSILPFEAPKLSELEVWPNL